MPKRRSRCSATRSRSCSTRARRRVSSRPRSSTAPATGRASCARARSRHATSIVCSRTPVTCSTTAKTSTPFLMASATPRAPTRPTRGRTGTTSPLREYLVVFLVAGTVSYLLCVVARELAMHAGAVAQVRDRDVHAIPIPYFGGIAMLGGLGAGYLVAHHLPFLSLAGEQVFHDAGVVIVAGAIICAVGVVDDLIELDALTKLGGQIVAAGILVLNEVKFYSVKLPVFDQLVLDPTQSALLTILLVVSTMNAVNFVDGLDGLAGGIVLIGALAFFVFSYKLADANGYTLAITAAVLCAAMGGACAGFLPHNFFPARIFMGDSGSMLLGLVLAGSALTLTGQFADVSVRGGGTHTSSVLVMLLP